ncbi:fructose-bisphosphate aldolase, class II [Geosmithia morbida]|uniref:Fructose-bisphosphate aldolase n=1 Tax=Geosmithia morbida TaxID=1094350 RepID=A0A9P4YS41_9HYPO|nr:fructose-bisphosphate aldolase, class II [Geosmithia morbida]KAF4121512.1 fructose-bisphosphate aldolase, class II [Geosmithia morbida]
MTTQTQTKNRALAIVDDAAAGGYGIAALCCYNIEGIIATVRAGEAKRAPVIIQLFPWAIEYADGLLVHAAREAADKASVPVAVHMDHAQSPEVIRRAAELGGFDGIMVDMSHYEKEENMSRTRELVAYLHGRGIIAEAEPGRINGGEDGVEDTGDLEGILTTPEQAGDFLDLGIDWLAPAFGNVHGRYGPGGPRLDFARLGRVHDVTSRRGVQLVLHGANDFGESHFRECVAHGMAKANINDAFNSQFTSTMRDRAGKVPLTTLLEEATTAMQKVIETHIDWLGSTGKAPLIASK